MTDFKDMSEEERQETVKQFVNKMDETVGVRVRSGIGWAKKIGGGFLLLIGLFVLLASDSSTGYLIGGILLGVGLLMFTYGLSNMSYTLKKIVAGLVLVVVGIGFSLFGVGEVKKGKASNEWPTVTGAIKESKLEEYQTTEKRGNTKKKVTKHRAILNYTYNIEGTSYTSNRIAFGGQPDSPYNLVNRYPSGKAVKVYYDPDNPKTSVLQPGQTKGSYFFVGFGAIISVFGVFFGFFTRNKK